MKVERFLTGIISTNCYLAVNEETKQAVVVDPAACPPSLMIRIEEEGLEITAILLTHGHFDHIMGLDGLLKEFIKMLIKRNRLGAITFKPGDKYWIAWSDLNHPEKKPAGTEEMEDVLVESY